MPFGTLWTNFGYPSLRARQHFRKIKMLIFVLPPVEVKINAVGALFFYRLFQWLDPCAQTCRGRTVPPAKKNYNYKTGRQRWFGEFIGGCAFMKPQHSWGFSPTPKPAKPQPFSATPLPTPWSTAGAPWSRTRPCMPSQPPFLIKT